MPGIGRATGVFKFPFTMCYESSLAEQDAIENTEVAKIAQNGMSKRSITSFHFSWDILFH